MTQGQTRLRNLKKAEAAKLRQRERGIQADGNSQELFKTQSLSGNNRSLPEYLIGSVAILFTISNCVNEFCPLL
jgi:hypothetical protein